MAIKNIVTATLVGLAGVATSASVFAADNKAPRFYVGGAIGQSKANSACDGSQAYFSSCSETDTGVKIFGGYQINPTWAVEAGYANLGEVTASGRSANASIKMNAFAVSAIGSIPVAQRVLLFGKLGAYSGEVKATGSGSRGRFASVTEHNTDLVYGFGAKWNFAKNLALRAEYERYNNIGNRNTIGESNVDLLSVGLLYKF
jgi:OOP family OmpA-OmpF porin